LKKQHSSSVVIIRAVIISGTITNVCLWFITIEHYAAASAQEVVNKVYYNGIKMKGNDSFTPDQGFQSGYEEVKAMRKVYGDKGG
jgi:hypothetical protein